MVHCLLKVQHDRAVEVLKSDDMHVSTTQPVLWRGWQTNTHLHEPAGLARIEDSEPLSIPAKMQPALATIGSYG
ncbi:MAG TPA: hypothetical protein VKR52_02115 [Terracidiphilus sp.]|nr:hypothetical protein [Terracidiphilus sp.]